MVTDAVLDWFFSAVTWMVGLLGSLHLPQTLVNLSWISDMNYFLPVSEMFNLFAAFFALGGPMAGTSLIVWLVVGVLRGGSSKA